MRKIIFGLSVIVVFTFYYAQQAYADALSKTKGSNEGNTKADASADETDTKAEGTNGGVAEKK